MHSELARAMIAYEEGNASRIAHFMKVYAYSKMIGEAEGLDEKTQYILEATALVHDIGIKPAKEKYGSSAGPYQEKEGIPVARKMLTNLGYEEDVVERVAYIVGHHHTYSDIDGLDYQILVEADFLVNLDEDHCEAKTIASVKEKIFKTKTGIFYLEKIFKKVLDI